MLFGEEAQVLVSEPGLMRPASIRTMRLGTMGEAFWHDLSHNTAGM